MNIQKLEKLVKVYRERVADHAQSIATRAQGPDVDALAKRIAEILSAFGEFGVLAGTIAVDRCALKVFEKQLNEQHAKANN